METLRSVVTVVVPVLDDVEFIGPFLEYHGGCLGYEHVHVYDLGSRHPDIPGIYETYRARGVEVHTMPADGKPLAEVITQIVREWDGKTEWVLPLLPWMFLLWDPSKSDATAVFPRTYLQAYLAMIHEDVSAMTLAKEYEASVQADKDAGYEHGAFSDPVFQVTHFQSSDTCISIVRPSALEAWTGWASAPKIAEGAGVQGSTSQLSVATFPYTGMRTAFERAMRALSQQAGLSVMGASTMDLFAGTVGVLSQDTPFVREASIAYKVLLRKLVIETFGSVHGCLPTFLDMERMIASITTLDSITEVARAAAPERSHEGPLADLLFAEPVGSVWDTNIYQLKNFRALK